MKVLFLDIDGVLNYEGCDSRYGSVYFVMEEKVHMLKEIISKTDAKIVLTSTWRHGLTDLMLGEETFEAGLYEAFINTLEEHDMEIYGCTGEDEATRGEEIEFWLQVAEEKIEGFVILDDMGPEQFCAYEPYLVQTALSVGLEQEHVNLVINMLNEELEDKK